MKRPFGVYLIAFWFFLGFGSFTWTPISRTVLVKVIDNPSIMKFVVTAGLILIIYTIVGIIQIKTIQVWIAVAIFSSMSVFYLITALSFIGVAVFDKKTIVILLYKLFMVLPSVGCVYYLLRPDFRSF